MRKKKGSNRGEREKNDSDQLSLNLPGSRKPEVVQEKEIVRVKKEDKPKSATSIIRLEDAQRKRERLDESKHIRAIIDLVRDYK